MDVFYVVEDLAPKLIAPFTSDRSGAAKGEVSGSQEVLGAPVQLAVIICYYVIIMRVLK